MSDPVELEKFIFTSSAAMSATFDSGAVDNWDDIKTTMRVGFDSSVPDWVKTQIISRAISGEYAGPLNVVYDNGITWLYDVGQEKWVGDTWYGALAPSEAQADRLDAIRDLRVEHQTHGLVTYDYTTGQVQGFPHVYSASGTYDIIKDLGWRNLDGSINLDAFLNAGNSNLMGSFFTIDSDDFYIFGAQNSFKLNTPYLDSLVQLGYLSGDGVLSVSSDGFTGALGQAWADVSSGRTTISNVKSFFASIFGFDTGELDESIKNFDRFVEELKAKDYSLNDYGEEAFGSGSVTDTTEYDLSSGDFLVANARMGGTLSDENAILVASSDGNLAFTLAARNLTTNVNNETYFVRDIIDAFDSAAQAVSNFINNLAESGIKWFNEGGAQVAFSAWLSQNIDDILAGDMNGEEALISLGQYLGGSFLSNFVVNDTLDAKVAIARVLYEEFNVGDVNPTYVDANGDYHLVMNKDENGNPTTPATEAGAYANAFAASLTQMTLSFVTSGFDAETALNVGVSTLAGELVKTYLVEEGIIGNNIAAGAVSTAVMTAVQGLLDFDGDWAQLGVQVGMAVSIYAATQGVTAVLAATEVGRALQVPILGIDPLTIISSLLISFIAPKIISKIYWGKVFKEGEFGSPQQVFNSIYQVQQIEVNGNWVDALVAVHPQGSTIIAQDISYIIGNSGSDVLVGNDSVGTIVANAGADYLEARGGDDNLLGGDGNDMLNG
ncbi:MAG: hypothetical protein DI582_09595, partial [Azospirillum brasilense]